ncbi:beta-L-arabinofuranosidase domain-containing protein [Maribacter cobaltidurans]|uniref:Glycosyl hydrolase n=1 Tax=Maribacter cobaltidurans TaxID=1178778 RepID=A0A223V2D2_9FLAO|nr:beta-L-arabinofuranosidase domain-containing protein [Maribacter cobaltidurans]ASV29009.1 hypothetical protein CJ263_01500 [Maribacter cobaltidurans]
MVNYFKKLCCFLWILPVLYGCKDIKTSGSKLEVPQANYLQNRTPLAAMPYLELPLGAIKPKSWLKEQLRRMADGMTGHLDEIYPQVLGPSNGWLGGDGDGWERGPYWIDGLLPLAYILNDANLKAKVSPWVEWTLTHQTEDGYLGPVPFNTEPEIIHGVQRSMRKDWWPKMVMLKVLQQHYNATADERVINVLTKYFRHQLKELPNRPLDDLTFWANRRGADNLQVVYWLYNITGDTFLLDLGEIIHEQTYPWSTVFLNEPNEVDSVMPYGYFNMKKYPFDSVEIKNTSLSQIGSIHTVNFAQGLKQPGIRYQKEPNQKYIDAIKKALQDIKKYHGQPQGMYGGDEPLHGTDPVQGVEFCSISEEMFSLETLLKITGDTEFADVLERIVYNALPAQASDDFSARQYFQAANQVELSDRLETSFETKNHKGTDFVFGVLTGYPCCTTNMHQSWPKYVQNLFYSTSDAGVAALLYAPSEVDMKVADNVALTITETTGFPFEENINFNFELSESATFPFHLRIPSWAKNPLVKVNGQVVEGRVDKQVFIINRRWNDGDEVILTLPMHIKSSKWHKGAISIERGPLVYALKLEGYEKVKNRNDGFGKFTEISTNDDWNFALLKSELNKLPVSAQVIQKPWDGSYPWNLENAPIEIKIKATKFPEWKLVNGAPVFPDSFGSIAKQNSRSLELEEITLVPYGCTTLRITEFPQMDR